MVKIISKFEKNETTWVATLGTCPYCKKDLNISSLSTRSIKDSIGAVIILSKIHLNECRGDKERELVSVSIQERTKKEDSEVIKFQRDKILS